MKLTARSAKWAGSVLANCKANTGRTLDQWVKLATKAGVKTEAAARTWGKAQGLSTVYQNAVVDALFAALEPSDDAMVSAQYGGAKEALRPIYDALVELARKLSDDVQILPRRSQVTLSRAKTFAVVRAATRTRVDVAFKLHGEKATTRLVLDAKAAKSDPSHVVGLTAVGDVDAELAEWMRRAYARAG